MPGSSSSRTVATGFGSTSVRARIDEHGESLGLVRTYPVVPYLLYALAPLPGTRDRLLRSTLDAVRQDPGAQTDRAAALSRSVTVASDSR